MSSLQAADARHGAPLPELIRVRTLCPLRQGDDSVPKGALGTIVHVYENGAAYEVEFTGETPAVLLARAADLERA